MTLTESVFEIKKNLNPQQLCLITGYARKCNQAIVYQELILLTCLWYLHQIKFYKDAVIDSFDSVAQFSEDMLRGIHADGWERHYHKPTFIQRHALKPIMNSYVFLLYPRL